MIGARSLLRLSFRQLSAAETFCLNTQPHAGTMKKFIRNCLILCLFAAPGWVAAQTVCSVNEAVNVYWAKPGEAGRWYAASVLKVNETQTRCYVRYKGYDSSWDEWVGADRLRRVAAPAAASSAVKYSVAHVKSHDRSWVFVKVSPRFLTADNAQVQKWYTAVQACARGANFAGDVVVVANVDGGFRYWGPVNAREFLRTLDMNWVNARVNKEMNCTF